MSMFLLKKIFTACILPPGCLIILLILAAIFMRKRLRLFLVCLSAFIYLLSIQPTKVLLLAPLERGLRPPTVAEVRSAGAYVLLGGGAQEASPDIDGKGTLQGESLIRLHGAYRLYQIEKRPIIISGGSLSNKPPEAEIAARILLQLGVRPNDVIAETKSLDTSDNARYVAEICRGRGITTIVLVTNAFHMKRSMLLFGRHFSHLVPYPVGYGSAHSPYDRYSLIPDAANMVSAAQGIKEYLAILIYKYFTRQTFRE